MRRAALALCALVIAGCGGDEDGGGATRTETVERTTRVEVPAPVQRSDRQFDANAIFRRDGPGVVTVVSVGLPGARNEDGGLGSGFVVSERGEIATNAHVVTAGEGRSIERADDVYVRFADGNQVAARIVGFDPFSDVALLRVNPKGLTLRPLPLGSAERIEVGDPVAAIGSPFGDEQSLSVGVVSALDRSIDSLTGFTTSGAIQTDAAINSGNSGGPLLDASGRVLGINSQIRTRAGDGTGVGFAVPVDTVKRSLEQLRERGEVRYAYLGVSTRGVYPQLAERFGLPVEKGAWVQEVVDGGPGDDAGLRAGSERERFQEVPWMTGGDVITAVDGKELEREADLGEALLDFEPGQEVELTIFRGDEERTVTVRLGTRPLQVRG